VALIGFDDIRMATVVTPALTTIHQPIVDLGNQAAEMLLSLLSKRDTNDVTDTKTLPEKTVLPTSLVVRLSCGCKGGDR
jgi:DNA-binding LacI/PurR family transcriptional regulator